MQAEAAHQKYRYEKLNKYFTKRKTSKYKTVNLADSSDRKSSSSSKFSIYSTKTGKTSIAYDSDSAGYVKISSSYTSSEENNGLDGCRDAFIIENSKTNSKSKLKEQKLSSNTLDAALNDAY